MNVGTISALYRYPVKSMAGERLEATELGPKGVIGDRAWAVRDEVNGGIRGAKKIPALMGLAARYPEPPKPEGSSPAEIVLPGGGTVGTTAADVNERLTEALDHAVSLWPLLPEDALDHYKRGAPTHEDFEVELRSIFGREEGEPLPNLGLFPAEVLAYESPPGTYFDVFPLMLMTDASLATLQSKAPDSKVDVRRFRPNIVVDTGDAAPALPEQAWRGKRLAIGDVVIEVTVECPRCVMVTHGFDDLPKDPTIMRTLVRETEGNLGVYAKVGETGSIRVGDPVRLVD